MGVDIAFYIEVPNQENWVRLHFKPPFETKGLSINHIGILTATSAGITTLPISLMRQQAISEEHIEAYYCVRRLRDIVSGIVAACHPYIYESDVRIFYLIC